MPRATIPSLIRDTAQIEEIRLSFDPEHPYGARVRAILKREGARHTEVVDFLVSLSGTLPELVDTVGRQYLHDEQNAVREEAMARGQRRRRRDGQGATT